MRYRHFLCLPLLLPACHNVPSVDTGGSALPNKGETLALSSCGGCHAVGRHGTSSNSNAPPFVAIVNQQGLTTETLTTWLRGAHNYPAEMDFYLGETEVKELVSYMLTLRDPNYRRSPDW